MNKIIFCKNIIRQNIQKTKKIIGNNVKICAVVKANAYGHGIENVVNATKDIVDYFAVANLDEALKVRQIASDKNVLVLGRLSKDEMLLATQNNIEFALVDMEHYKELCTIAKETTSKINIHLKINSGMNRLGFDTVENFKKVVKGISIFDNIEIAGIFTHFADCKKKNLHKQKAKFQHFLNFIDTSNLIIHASNSEAFLHDKSLCYDMVRIGISLYTPTNAITKYVKPPLSIFSQIVQIHSINKGETVGYGCEFQPSKTTQIGVVGVGYADGIMRKSAKNGYVLIQGKKCKIVGRICMDMLFVDLGNKKNISTGEEVVIVGKSKKRQVTLNDWAKWCDTIPYEICTQFNMFRGRHNVD